MKSRLEIVRDIIVDGLAGIKDSVYPSGTIGTTSETSAYPYRSNVKAVYKTPPASGEKPYLCVMYDSCECDMSHANSTQTVFDLLSHFEIRGWYSSAQTTAPGQVIAPMEVVGHALAHDVMRWLTWNELTYRDNADPDLRWMIDDKNFKLKMITTDNSVNDGYFTIDFWVRVKSTTRDLI